MKLYVCVCVCVSLALFQSSVSYLPPKPFYLGGMTEDEKAKDVQGNEKRKGVIKRKERGNWMKDGDEGKEATHHQNTDPQT